MLWIVFPEPYLLESDYECRKGLIKTGHFDFCCCHAAEMWKKNQENLALSIYLHVPLAFCFPHFLSPSAASPSSSAPIFPSPRNTRDGSIKCIELHPWLICRAKKRSRGRCLFSAPLSPLGLLQPACLNSQRGRFIKTDQKNEGQHIATQIGWGVSDSQ